MDNQPPLPPLPPRRLIQSRQHGLRNLSIGLIVLSILPIAWFVFSKIETPTENDTITTTAGNASAPAQRSLFARIVCHFQLTSMCHVESNTAHPLQPMKNDVETKMCQVADRDLYHEIGVTTLREVPFSEQVPVDDKLTAEEVIAAVKKDPSVRLETDVPIFGIRVSDGEKVLLRPRPVLAELIRLYGDRGQPVIDIRKLSQSERVRLCGLRRIHRMAALTLYNNRCGDRPDDDKTAAAAIIESQFKKLPTDVQESTLDYQVKAIEARSASYDRGVLLDPGGWKWFCDRMNDDIKNGKADPMFKTAREGFFPIEGN